MNLNEIGQKEKRGHGQLEDWNLHKIRDLKPIEASETDGPPAKDEPQLAIQDKPVRARPRFDPTREHVAAQENC